MNFATVCCILLISGQATGEKLLSVRTAPEGIISSPGFPLEYPSDLDTEWRIERPKGQRIRLEFLKFNLEWESQCAFDRVTVYDGYNSSAKKLGSYCGSGLPGSIISTGRFLYIRMLTDDSVCFSGFLAKYKCFEGPLVTDTTTQTVVTTDTETTSTSPSPGTQVTQETSTAGAGRIQTLRRDPNVPTAAPRNVPRIDTQSTQSTHYPLFRYGRIGRSPFRSPSRRKKHPLGSIHVASLGLGYILSGASGTISPQWLPIFLGMSTLLR